MKIATISELKRELQALPAKEVVELCLHLARFKKDNKELLNYLLFEANDQQGYLESIKNEMNESFSVLPRSNMYFIKKGLRKMLRLISKYTKHSTAKEFEFELLIHFCRNLVSSGIRFRTNKALLNLWNQQLKKLNSLADQVHEDLAFDYKKQLQQLT